MNLEKLRAEAHRIVTEHPVLKRKIQDLYERALNEIEAEGSEKYECDLVYGSMLKLQNAQLLVENIKLKHGGVRTERGKVLSPRFATVGPKILGAIDRMIARVGCEEVAHGAGHFFNGKWFPSPYVTVKPHGHPVREFHFKTLAEAERCAVYLAELNDYHTEQW